MQDNKQPKPKVFISYAHEDEDFVLDFDERLRKSGVEVVIDKRDLKFGQDIYAFMERCVTDPSILKVLIICSKAYKKKANARKGGVGSETMIISSEVYKKAKQEKFIPIVIEKDKRERAFLPKYLDSRRYADLSNAYDYSSPVFRELLQSITGEFSEQSTDPIPDLVQSDSEKETDFPSLRQLLSQIENCNVKKKQSGYAERFIEEYIETLRACLKSFTNILRSVKIWACFKNIICLKLGSML